MNTTKISQSIKLAVLGTALAVGGVAMAADAGGAQRHGDRAGHHHCLQAHGHHGHGVHKHHGFHHGAKHHAGKRGEFQRAGLIVPGYGVVSRDFVAGMGLNADQQKLIEEARQASKDLREQRKEAMKTQRGARAERFNTDKLDPQQALKQAEERRAQHQAERRKIEEKWLAVWNALDGDQQARVATHLKDRAEKARQLAEKRAERKQQREARDAVKNESA